MAKKISRIGKVEQKVDQLGFRIKVMWGLIILNIGTAVLLRFI
jgi:hypothetical protein